MSYQWLEPEVGWSREFKLATYGRCRLAGTLLSLPRLAALRSVLHHLQSGRYRETSAFSVMMAAVCFWLNVNIIDIMGTSSLTYNAMRMLRPHQW